MGLNDSELLQTALLACWLVGLWLFNNTVSLEVDHVWGVLEYGKVLWWLLRDSTDSTVCCGCSYCTLAYWLCCGYRVFIDEESALVQL